ncbi:sulfite exporter TauE/SafE family protein [Mariprofundus sp. KV]|uniref:sulfite exporter TauE/SafE family protein n=1 Tax=Mariprofundus sp. KV TaxID=2608715 RepID=UPI00159FE867|nr:sulfite exporter TauE/SafE family protein [Mariprofundus sp. KV]NWF37255.1 sulfite exporter TauE/SafE family protein [Mariprofundus sp. KV]
MELLLIAFSVGFFGSMHCVGMCGGLVSALSMTRPKVWWSGLAAYQFGRVTTYAMLGVVSGLIGFSLKQLGSFDQVQFFLTLFAGLIMITFGLNLAGWMPDPFARLGARAIGGLGLANRIRSAASKRTPVSWFAIGVANGLLPCGLVYAALGLSVASGGVAEAGSAMLAFGLGTIPAMMAAPALVNLLAANRRSLVLKLLGILVILLGLFTMVRGTSLMHMLHGGGVGHDLSTHQMSPPSAQQNPMQHRDMNHVR